MKKSAEVIGLPRGTLNVAAIEYHCDLTHRDGEIIQVGALAEIVLPGIRGIGLIARTELDEKELRLVGDLVARTLAKPFDFFVKQIEDAWKKAEPQKVIEYFAQSTGGSLVICQPENRTIPNQILAEVTKISDKNQASTAASQVRKFLCDTLEDKMLAQIWDTLPPTLQGFQKAEPDLEKKAA